ncbi:MAG: pyruvate formate lyase family protein, partial [Chloroflexota bacterium]
CWGVRTLKALELALFNGVDPLLREDIRDRKDEIFEALSEDPRIGPATGDPTKFKSFEELMQAHQQQFRWMMKKSASIKSVYEHWSNQLLKRPFASCLFHRSLDACRDIMDCPEKGMPWANDPGTVDCVDSLVGLKKLVFDDKKYTLEQVIEAMAANWEGYEEMRQEFVNAPKYGNNDDYADQVAKSVYSMAAEEMCGVRDVNNASPMRSGLVVSRMFAMANHIGALPNGRRLGDWLGDGGISPHATYDRSGPMAAVLSASKIDGRKQKANIFNQKLSPASVSGDDGLKKLQNYVETAMHLGLDMIQFNVVDVKTLKDAQAHPEKYQDLVVRISGFNAHFVDLNKFVQDSVIGRTEHALV